MIPRTRPGPFLNESPLPRSLATSQAKFQFRDRYSATDAGDLEGGIRSGCTWSYDAIGNETAGASTDDYARTAEKWTGHSQMSSITVAGKTYAGQYGSTDQSERIKLGDTFFHNGPLGLSAKTTAGVDMGFNREPGGTLNSMTTGGKTYYYLTDAIGSVVALADGDGNKVNTYAYSPRGVRILARSSEPVAQPYRFAGGYQDPTGLYHFQARYYDANIGRFTQPDPSGQEKNPYLYAERRDMCLPITGAPDWNMRLHTLIRRVQDNQCLRAALEGQGFKPDLSHAHQGHRRARGVALSSSGLRSDRTHVADGGWRDEDVIEVQLFEGGGLRLFMTRLSDGLKSHASEDEEEQVLFDAGAVILTRHMLELTRLISDDVGYHGNWAVAVGANRLRGRRRYSGQSHWPSNHRYSADTYEESTGTTLAELRDAPGTATRRLLGPLLRSLDSEELFTKALTDEG